MSEITELIDEANDEASNVQGDELWLAFDKLLQAVTKLAAKVGTLEQWRPTLDGDLTAKYLTELQDRVEALEKMFDHNPRPPRTADEATVKQWEQHHKPAPPAQTLVDCAAHARELCFAIEDLPASEQQTVCSIQASGLSQKLHALLRQEPSPHHPTDGHAGDCTIYAALMNGRPEDGICTCGYGRQQWTLGDYSKMYSEEKTFNANSVIPEPNPAPVGGNREAGSRSR